MSSGGVANEAEAPDLLHRMKQRNLLSVPLQERPIEQINEILKDVKLGRISGRAIAVLDSDASKPPIN